MEAVALAAATYYLTYVLTRSNGPLGVFYRLRRYKWLPLHCTPCTAFWAAIAVFALWNLKLEPAIYVLALAGVTTFTDDIRQTLLILE